MKECTKEEISLCKQVAERHWKKLSYGDWWIGKGDAFLMNIPGDTLFPVQKHKDITPLWTISDCLKFLRERGFRYDLEDYHINPNDLICVIMSGGKRNVNRLTFEGKTPLEACLKAVLAILEEE